MTKVFLLHELGGEYEDHSTSVVGVSLDKSKIEELKVTKEDEHKFKVASSDAYHAFCTEYIKTPSSASTPWGI